MGQPVLNNSLCPVYTADGGLGYIIKTRESERRWDRKKNMLQNVSGIDKGRWQTEGRGEGGKGDGAPVGFYINMIL